MDSLDRWDVVLLCVAAFVATTALVRLMARRRNQLVSQLHGQARRQGRDARQATDAEASDDSRAA